MHSIEFSTQRRARSCLRAFCIGTLAALVYSLLAASDASAQGPLTPSTVLQNPAAPAFFAEDYLAGPLSAYNSDAYSQLLTPLPLVSAATNSYIGATVLSWVYRDPANGDLAFVYQFNNSSLATNDLARATINDPSNPWTPFTIFDAGADGSGHSSSPGGSTTWTNGNPFYLQQDAGSFGLIVQFDFGNLGTILNSPHDSSSEIWFATNALNFDVTGVGLSDSSATGTASAYGPAAGVFIMPEPSTIAIAADWRRPARCVAAPPLRREIDRWIQLEITA